MFSKYFIYKFACTIGLNDYLTLVVDKNLLL